MSLHLSNKSITEIEVNVIVNAANGVGAMGAGVAGAIARAGGNDLVNEFNEYCRHYNPQPGSVFMTRSGKMDNCFRVYHAVTMKYPGTSYIDDNEKGLDIVTACIDNIFNMFNNHPHESIAIPALATGVGGLSYYEVAKIMVKTAIAYGFHKDEKRKVIFCDLNKEFLYNCKLIYKSEVLNV